MNARYGYYGYGPDDRPYVYGYYGYRPYGYGGYQYGKRSVETGPAAAEAFHEDHAKTKIGILEK